MQGHFRRRHNASGYIIDCILLCTLFAVLLDWSVHSSAENIPTVFGLLESLDELKLSKQASARFLKDGGAIDGSDLEEIFQALPHLQGSPRRPPRRRRLKSCGENWCFGSCPKGKWTTYGGCGRARRLRDVGRYSACPEGVWRSQRGIGCCSGPGNTQEGVYELIPVHCQECTPCDKTKHEYRYQNCIGARDGVCKTCPPGRTLDEEYDISDCDESCKVTDTGCKACYSGENYACKPECPEGSKFVRAPRPDGGPGPGTCQANACSCIGGLPVEDCIIAGERDCGQCLAGRYLVSVDRVNGKFGECSYCPPNHYSDTVSAATECIQCPTGYTTMTYDVLSRSFRSYHGQSYCTEDCPAGKYLHPFDGKCSACPAGMYYPISGLHTSCELCETGFYTSETGQANETACKACPGGKAMDDGIRGADQVSFCKDCDAGMFINSKVSMGKYGCAHCYKGMWSNEIGAPYCKSCPKGRYNAQRGADTDQQCNECSKGKYSASWRNGFCKQVGVDTKIEETYETTQTDCLNWCQQKKIDAYARCCSWDGYTKECKAYVYGGYSINIGADQNPNRTYFKLDGLSLRADCLNCPSGQYSSGSASQSCKLCPEGRKGSGVGKTDASSCKICEAGRFQSDEGMKECEKCPSGTFLEDDGTSPDKHVSIYDCTVCPEGKYNEDEGQKDEDDCENCPSGFINPDDGKHASKHDSHDDCILCPSGKYQDTMGAVVCKSCPPGKMSASQHHGGSFADSIDSACEDCKRGMYQSEYAQVNCTACPAGSYLDALGSNTISNCTSCDKGRYFDAREKLFAQSLDDCKYCPHGFFNEFSAENTEDSYTKHAQCSECPGGFYQQAQGASECNGCPKGRYNSKTGMGPEAKCLFCKEGTYVNKVESLRCEECPAGLFGDEIGATDGSNACKMCPAGKTTSFKGMNECTNCSKKTYLPSSKRGRGSPCLKCEGVTTPGATHCPGCDAGEYGTLGSIQNPCQSCPGGWYSEGGDTDTCLKCPPGTHQEEPSSVFFKARCAKCRRGKYSSETARISETACSECPAGFYGEGDGYAKISDACLPCQAGRYNNLTGQGTDLACLECEEGRWSDKTQHDSDCQECEPGKFKESAGQSFECDPCAEGKYQAEAGKNQCNNCGPGQSQFHVGGIKCEKCERGMYALEPEGSPKMMRCRKCPIGFAQPGLGSSSCNKCQPGSYSRFNGSLTCQVCPAGRYNDEGIDFCKDCPKGRFQEKKAAFMCNKCPKGFSQSQMGQRRCEPCKIGRYQELEGLAGCNTCPEGSTTNGLAGSQECTECPEGRVDSGSIYIDEGCTMCRAGMYRRGNSETCQECTSGMFSAEEGLAECKNCRAGFYQDQTGGKNCKKCEEDHFSDESGQNECARCKEGKTTMKSLGATDCQVCPEGTYGMNVTAINSEKKNSSQNCMVCPRGYYRGTVPDENISNALYCQICPAGYLNNKTGIAACSICGPGFYQEEEGMGICKACTPFHYQDESGSLLCKTCKAGKFTAITSSVLCQDCIGGKYGTQDGKPCSGCPKGYHRESTDDGLACKECPIGFTTNYMSNVSNCVTCPRGTYQDQTGKYTCKACNIPELECENEESKFIKRCRYQDNPGKDSCKVCDPGQIPDPTATSCIQPSWITEAKCALGQALDNSNNLKSEWKCIECPKGASCDGRPTVIGKVGHIKGYWSVPWDCITASGRQPGGDCNTDRIRPRDFPLFVKCPYPHACKSSNEAYSRLLNSSVTSQVLMDVVDELDDDVDENCKNFQTPLKKYFEAFSANSSSQRKDSNFIMCEDKISQEIAAWDNRSSTTINETAFVDEIFDDEYSLVRYYVSNLRADSCTDTTTGPLCGLCKKGYYRESRTAADCIQCTNETVPVKFGLVLLVVIAVIVVLLFIYRQLVHIHENHIHTFRHLVRIGVITLSYFQVSTSLPRLVYIEWPTDYLQLLDSLSFVNVDVFALLGLKCIQILDRSMDFRDSIVIMSFVPVVWCGAVFSTWLHHAHWIGMLEYKSKKQRDIVAIRAISFIYDIVDFNQDGYIDDREFSKVLAAVNVKGAKNMKHSYILLMMQQLGATHVHGNRYLNDDDSSSEEDEDDASLAGLYHYDHDENNEEDDEDREPLLRLTLENLQNAAKSNKLSQYLGSGWIAHADSNRIRSFYLGVSLMFCFFMHAPISQRYFYYFACHDVGGNHYMRGDYSLRCHIGEHQDFKPFVVLVMLLFTFAFPSFLLYKLWVHKDTLRLPVVYQVYGFLYRNYTEGAEAWEIHEITRKCILIGGLVFVQRTTDKCMLAVCVCLLNVCLLAYYKPHFHKAVFYIEMASFVFTSMKYFSVVLLNVQNFSGSLTNTGDLSEQKNLGYLLISLDGFFGIGSICVAVMVALGAIMKKPTTMKKPTNGERKIQKKQTSASVKEIPKILMHKNKRNKALVSGTQAVTAAVCLIALLSPNPTNALGCRVGQYCNETDQALCQGTSARCIHCDAGKYADEVGSTTCKECVMGKYYGTAGSNGCFACAPGRYSNISRAETCNVCPAGKYTNEEGSSTCKMCPLGSYLEDEGDEKLNKVAEYLHNELSDCTVCESGKFHDENVKEGQTSKLSCKDCPIGTYNSDRQTDYRNHTSCKPCPIGSYGDEKGEAISVCKLCPAGKYNDNIRVVSVYNCKVCPAGRYSSRTGNTKETACDPCPKGSYLTIATPNSPSNHDNVDDCITCPLGKYNTEEGSAGPLQCKDCEKGKYNGGSAPHNPSSRVKCTNCAVGSYQNEKGKTTCKLCERGQAADTSSVEVGCRSCEAGTYSDDEGALSCKFCPRGLFGVQTSSRTSMANACQTCNSGQTTSNVGMTSCQDCPAKYYLPEEMVSEGSYCLRCATASNEGQDQCLSDDQSCGSSCETCKAGQFGVWSVNLDCKKCPVGFFSIGGDPSVCIECPSGWYQENNNKPLCNPCPSGKYSEITGLTNRSQCVSCGEGLYGLKLGAEDQISGCAKCPKGTYSQSQHAASVSECKACEPGKYNEELGEVDHCKPCVEGKYVSNSRSTSEDQCKQCPVGKYSSETSSTSCKKCDSGKYQSENGQLHCKECNQGEYSMALGAMKCKKCPEGFFQKSKKEQSCESCPPGKRNNKVGAAYCRGCTSGMFQPNSASVECQACPQGYSQEYKENPTLCISCSAGFYQNEEKQSDCKFCTTGYYQSETASHACKRCPLGYEGNQVLRSRQCIACKAGQHIENAEATKCTNCPKGKFREYGTLNVSCIDCPQGKFTENSGSSFCKSCSPGEYANLTGSIICNKCEPETYNDMVGQAACLRCRSGGTTQGRKGYRKCDPCPRGKFGENSDIMLMCRDCLPGTYRSTVISLDDAKKCTLCPTGWYQNENTSSLCFQCTAGKYAADEGSKHCKLCSEGEYSDGTAVVCRVCPKGYTSINLGSASCQKCKAGQYGTGCKDCIAGRYRGVADLETDCIDCPPGRHTDNTEGNEVCQACDVGQVTNETGQPTCSNCKLGQFQGNKGETHCEYCSHDQKKRSRQIDKETNASCLTTSWIQAGDCLNGEFLNDSLGWNHRQDTTNKSAVWTCTRGNEERTLADLNYKSICSEGAACDKWEVCSYWHVDEDSLNISCPEEIKCEQFVWYVGNLSSQERTTLFHTQKFMTTLSNEAVNASALYDCCLGVENVSLQLTTENKVCNMKRPQLIDVYLKDEESVPCHRSNSSSGQFYAAQMKKTQLYSHSWVSAEDEGKGEHDDQDGTCEPFPFEYNCRSSCFREKRRFDSPSDCRRAICMEDACPSGPINAKSLNCEEETSTQEPYRGYFLFKKEYTSMSQYLSSDPSEFYSAEDFNCFCYNNTLEYTVFDLDKNLTVKSNLDEEILIKNKRIDSGPISILQLGHKQGYWNVTWGPNGERMERWRDPYFTPCPYKKSCLSTSDAITYYRLPPRTQRFGMLDAPAWHKYDLNTDLGRFYLNKELGMTDRNNSDGTNSLDFLQNLTLFEDIDTDKDDFATHEEFKIFLEMKKDFESLDIVLEEIFGNFDGNGDNKIDLHLEWLSRSCAPTTTGLMCGNCRVGHFRDGPGSRFCDKCDSTRTALTVVIFFIAVVLISCLIYLLRQKMTHNKQRRLINTSSGLLNEVLSYYQIGKSITVNIDIAWPSFYLKFMNFFDIFNLDIPSLMNLQCVNYFFYGKPWGLTKTIMLYSFLPFAIVATLITMYTFQTARLKKRLRGALAEMRERELDPEDEYVDAAKMKISSEISVAVEFMFDTVDFNNDGFLDETEFRRLLAVIGYGGNGQRGKRKRAKLSSTEVVHMMRKLGGVPTKRGKRMWRLRQAGMKLMAEKMKNNKKRNSILYLKELKRNELGLNAGRVIQAEKKTGETIGGGAEKDHGHAEFVLMRRSMLTAADDGKVEAVLGTKWVRHALISMTNSIYSHALMYLFFIMHAPITQKLFIYSSCDNISGRYFNRVDFALECYTAGYNGFLMFVLLVMGLYSFGFPGVAIAQLIKYRSRLHTPEVMQKLGFLYGNSVVGAESWLMFCLMRKMFLIGAIVFLQPFGPTSASICAVSLCTFSCILLNYLRPHRISVLFFVQQVSFAFTTCKYLSVILKNTNEHRQDNSEALFLYLLLTIDILFLIMIGSLSLWIIFQALTGSGGYHRDSINLDDDSEDDDSSDDDWSETFDRQTKKKNVTRKLKKLKKLEETTMQRLNGQKADAAARLASYAPRPAPRLKRAMSGRASAPPKLAKWFESIRVGLSSQLVSKLIGHSISDAPDFLHLDSDVMKDLKVSMKKTERKRFTRAVDSLLKSQAPEVSKLLASIQSIKAMEEMINASEKYDGNHDNVKALKEQQNQMKAALKLKVEFCKKISDLKARIREDMTNLGNSKKDDENIEALKLGLQQKKAELEEATRALNKLEM